MGEKIAERKAVGYLRVKAEFRSLRLKNSEVFVVSIQLTTPTSEFCQGACDRSELYIFT